jgi:Short C-terminal domain
MRHRSSASSHLCRAVPQTLMLVGVLLLGPRWPAAGADAAAESSLRLVGGEINGQSITPDRRRVIVRPGERIAGSVRVLVNSSWPSFCAMAMGVTPSWGDHATSYLDLGGFSTPVNGLERTISLNLTAPSTAGAYHVIAAFSATFTAGQVMSCTNWSAGQDVWNNRDDIADWPAAVIEAANANGRVQVPCLSREGEAPTYVPATAIEILVSDTGTSAGNHPSPGFGRRASTRCPVASPRSARTVVVSGRAGPWDPELNGSFAYGRGDQEQPQVICAVDGTPLTAGMMLRMYYLNGSVRAGGGWPDADGLGAMTHAPANDGDYPSRYIDPSLYPIYVGSLIGVFAHDGVIVGRPIKIGNGQLHVTVPPGANQLLLGVNDNIFGDNTGSWTVAVEAEPSSAAASSMALYAGGAILVLVLLAGAFVFARWMKPAGRAAGPVTEEVLGRLTKLKSVFDAGLITEDEYARQKARVLLTREEYDAQKQRFLSRL